MRTVTSLLLLAGLAGCASQASVPAQGNYKVYTSYSDKIPGKYGIFIDGSDFKGEVPCGAFPSSFDASTPFRLATLRTMENLIDDVVLLDNPISADEATRDGFTGVIIIRSQDSDIDVNLGIGVEVEVELVASAEAYRGTQKVLGFTAQGDGEAPLVGACPGLGEALGDATGDAMSDLLGNLGQRISNESRLR